MKKYIKLLLGTSLALLDQTDRATTHARGRLGDRLDDLRDMALRKCESAAYRVARASRGLRRSGGSGALRNSLRFAAGLGVGVGVALLAAPATGKQTRSALSNRAQRFGNHVRKNFSSGDLMATGTGD